MEDVDLELAIEKLSLIKNEKFESSDWKLNTIVSLDSKEEYLVFSSMEDARELAIRNCIEFIKYHPELVDVRYIRKNYVNSAERFRFLYIQQESDRIYNEDPEILKNEMVDVGTITEDEIDSIEINESLLEEHILNVVDILMNDDDGYDYYRDNYGEREANEIVIDLLNNHQLRMIALETIDEENGLTMFLPIESNTPLVNEPDSVIFKCT